MKKILFVANVAREHINKFHIPTIKAFKAQGWQVDVICEHDADVPECDTQYDAVWTRSPWTIKTFKGVRQLRKLIESERYDVVYCHTPVGGLIARLASRKARKEGTKVVYFAHGFHFYEGAPLINWWLYYPMEKLLSKMTDEIFVINQEDYENATQRLCCPKVTLLDGVGVNLERYVAATRESSKRDEYREKLNIPQDAQVMIYLAEINDNKNQKMLVDVLANLPEYYLVLAGIDHQDGKLEAYAKTRGVDARLRCLGWCDDGEWLYQMADVCTASSVREGFGINLVEAMASGLPVVATANRGHKTIIQDGVNGYLVPLGDIKLFSEKVEFAIANKGELTKKYDLQKYDEQVIIRKLYEYINVCTRGDK